MQTNLVETKQIVPSYVLNQADYDNKRRYHEL